jgi:methylmalonyl-CoA mutase C-terminal domain/subunit
MNAPERKAYRDPLGPGEAPRSGAAESANSAGRPPRQDAHRSEAAEREPGRKLSSPGPGSPDSDTSRGTRGRIRVVVAKPGLDGHDRGAKIIARALRDAGIEVIYTGLHQTPEQIVETAIQEDADAVGLSILSGAHMTLVPRIMELLAEQGVEDLVVTLGGTIPGEDIEELKALGVAGVFTPGTTIGTIVEFIRDATARAAP